MVNRVFGYNPFCLIVVVAAGVKVPVKAGEIAARNFETDLVSLLEINACCGDIDSQLIYLSRFHEHLFSKAQSRIPQY